GLAIAVGIYCLREATLGSKQRRYTPTAQEASLPTMLRLVERQVIDQASVEQDADVIELRAIHGPQVPGIRHRVAAGGLGSCAGSQRLSPGQVGLSGDAVPLVESHCRERRVVVAVAIAEAHGKRGQLAADRRTRRAPGVRQGARERQ